MYSRTIDTNENTIRHRWPCWILCTAIETRLIAKKREKSSQNRLDHIYSRGIWCWSEIAFTLFVACARNRWNTDSISALDGPLVLAIFCYFFVVVFVSEIYSYLTLTAVSKRTLWFLVLEFIWVDSNSSTCAGDWPWRTIEFIWLWVSLCVYVSLLNFILLTICN